MDVLYFLRCSSALLLWLSSTASSALFTHTVSVACGVAMAAVTALTCCCYGAIALAFNGTFVVVAAATVVVIALTASAATKAAISVSGVTNKLQAPSVGASTIFTPHSENNNSPNYNRNTCSSESAVFDAIEEGAFGSINHQQVVGGCVSRLRLKWMYVAVVHAAGSGAAAVVHWWWLLHLACGVLVIVVGGGGSAAAAVVPPTASWRWWRGVALRMAPLCVCLVAVMQWRAYRRHTRAADKDGVLLATEFQVRCYCGLPLRAVSRWWGYCADIELPTFLRPFIYSAYINTFGVNLSEAVNDDLKSYPSLSDFFAREIRNETRPIDRKSCVVSPCDGTVLHFGTVQMGRVEQVKGVTYALEDFLGVQSWNTHKTVDGYHQKLLKKQENNTALFQCVIYLAPGDYHRFHSPVEWSPTYRRHFAGELLSVNPNIARWVPGLFCLNERAVYLGEWKHGFFSYTAVGATNVGSIRVNFDRKLQTNATKKSTGCHSGYRDQVLGSAIQLKAGELIGEFRMGSTIVLIFEAPATFKFSVQPGDRVKVGQGIGCVPALPSDNRGTA